MTKTKYYDLVKSAVCTGRFKKLLLGEAGMENMNLKHVPASVPSDITAILEQGVYPLHKDGFCDGAMLLEYTVKELLNGSAVELWIAYSLVWNQCRKESNKISPFFMVTQPLLTLVGQTLWAHQEELRQCQQYVGMNRKEGIWEHITVTNDTLQTRYGVSIL